MPLYQLVCNNEKCAKHVKIMEYMIPLSRYDDEVKCPDCNEPLEKIMSAVPFKIN
jgi:putative FmdB family regulatory protein